MVDNLLHEFTELPHVLDLAVHLVHLTTWIGSRGHTETFSLLACDFGVTPSPLTKIWTQTLDLGFKIVLPWPNFKSFWFNSSQS